MPTLKEIKQNITKDANNCLPTTHPSIPHALHHLNPLKTNKWEIQSMGG